ncbi:MAG: AbrB/MazE/SpoVT family DNA-binding domain-containing protein [Ardenticatenales bacterium]|nr:AbrB/MazE/SpoVT family DNA-binding domain-containing protein [Ardenticatenales bacterium]
MTSAIATVTAKGQVTIPKPVRDALGITEHSKILFVLEDGVLKVVPIGRRSLSELAGALPATRPWPGMAIVRDEVRREREAARGGGES